MSVTARATISMRSMYRSNITININSQSVIKALSNRNMFFNELNNINRVILAFKVKKLVTNWHEQAAMSL